VSKYLFSSKLTTDPDINPLLSTIPELPLQFKFLAITGSEKVVMLSKRILPCLDVKAGRVVKGINFVDLKDAGDPVELAKVYNEAGVFINANGNFWFANFPIVFPSAGYHV